MKSVIVIDDSATMLTLAELALRGAGYRVSAVKSWHEAMQYIPTADVALVDLNMPGLDGDSIVLAIRAAAPLMKIYIYSSESELVVKNAVNRSHADGCILEKGNAMALINQMIEICPPR